LPEIREAEELDDPLPRRWRVPLRFEEAEIVLENLGGDWPRYRRMKTEYQARLIATRRVKRMLEGAQAHDMNQRSELRKAAGK